MKTLDAGQAETAKLIEKVEKRVNKEYSQATKDMQKKLNNYLKSFESKDKAMQKQLADGLITEKQYKDWRYGQIMVGKRWQEQLDVLSKDLENSRQIAMNIVSGELPSAFAIGHNYGTYLVESGTSLNTSYTLYNRDTVSKLIKDRPKLLPDPTKGSKTAQALKSKQIQKWSKAKMTSAVAQGVLQGESIPKIASRLRSVTDMSYRASIRNARTMLTSSENLGRQASFERAQDMGIEMEKQWLATLDDRTRDSHALLDGERVPLDENFSNGLEYPADPSGEPEEIYNCRCTMVTAIKGFEKALTDFDLSENEKLGGMSYEEWKDSHLHNDTENGIIDIAKEVVDTSSDVLQGFERTQDYLNDLYDIASANPENEKAVRLIEENRKEVADLFGVTEEQAAKFLDDGIAKIIEDSEMTIAIDASKFEKVLSDGYFKNQFETNSSGGILSFDDRKRCEFKEFNVPTGSKILDADRPIYGALQPKYDPDDVDAIYTWQRMGGARYGNGIKVILDKDKVINNSTVTIGDSLNRQFDIFGTEMANPKFTGAVWGEEDMIARVGAGEASAADAIKAMTEYYEFQLHGKDTHSIDIIEKVMIDASQIFGKKSVIKMLDDKGIPWELYGRKNQIEDAMQWLNT